MLIDGSELTKEDRESQLYDDFEHFRQHKEESIHDYYVRFAKLINDMRSIKMTMSKLQLNSKFLNNMLPEWGRFVTVVKLNRGLRDSNYDQLFAYLKQHEAHAKENKMMLEPDDLIENLTSTLALLTQSYRTFLPQTNNQLRTSSNLWNQATVQDGIVVVQNVQGRPNRGQGMNPRGGSAAGYGEAQNRVGNVNQGQARLGQARTVKCYNCNDDTGAYHEEHVMHDSVQLDHGVDLHADYTTVSNMISYDQYVKDNEVPVVHSNASSVPNDTFMMIYNDMCEPSAHLCLTRHGMQQLRPS
nr:hypothetical protein [Tanacetum cinerariifolium]